MSATAIIDDPKTFATLMKLDKKALRKLHEKVRTVLEVRQEMPEWNNENHVGVRLRLDEKTLLKELAALRGSTVSEEVRKAIRAHLKHCEAALAREIGRLAE
jgi:hypothetical protein